MVKYSIAKDSLAKYGIVRGVVMAECSPELFLEQFMRTVHKYIRFEEQKRYYGTDILITVAEIHTIDAIGKSGSINLINLSKAIGVTKGSVSQMIYKLVDKGLVNKSVSPSSDREIVITLTKKGQQAFDGHRQMHIDSALKMNSLVDDMPQEVLAVSLQYLENFEDRLDELLSE